MMGFEKIHPIEKLCSDSEVEEIYNHKFHLRLREVAEIKTNPIEMKNLLQGSKLTTNFAHVYLTIFNPLGGNNLRRN